MPKETVRTLPRPFSLHWGNGRIVEEATYAGQHHQPSLQLLEFEDGSAAVRFCYYDHAGRTMTGPRTQNPEPRTIGRRVLVLGSRFWGGEEGGGPWP